MLVAPADLVPAEEGTLTLPGGRRLGWASYGDPEGDVVVWCHGTPGGRRQLPADAPGAARERGLRLVGFDRPGTGGSTTHQYRQVADVVDDVRALLDHLGVERCAVGGLSGGGPYALALAWGLPDRVVAAAVLGGVAPTRGPEHACGIPQLLVPAEPVLRFVARPLAELVSLAMKPARPYMSPVFDAYVRLGPSSDREHLRRPDVKAALLYDLGEAIAGGVRAPLFDLVVFGRPWGFSLREVLVPTVLWHGDADGIVPFVHGTHQAGLLPEAELRVCEGDGHFAAFVRFAEVLDALSDRWPGRPGGRAHG